MPGRNRRRVEVVSVRVTGGEFKGRILNTVTGLSARPTSSAVRNAMFNILGDYVPEAKVADFFCAGGTLGIEALSHGASECCFVDNGFKAVKALKENIKMLGIEERARVISSNVLTSFPLMEETGLRFDIIFADPPYKKPLVTPLLKKLRLSSVIKENTILVLECSSRDSIKFPDGIEILKERKSGDTAVYFISFDKKR
ncbi:MAG: 16S rRNA (guanine(966)-N(2))-methyltransferase RsmD [candidate division Zixibacteria bacterium]|nr:16S rRNA (guanine(966)-N(2))-methyltransferase RsmD [candidate division Zixibacteria bacterium]